MFRINKLLKLRSGLDRIETKHSKIPKYVAPYLEKSLPKIISLELHGHIKVDNLCEIKFTLNYLSLKELRKLFQSMIIKWVILKRVSFL